MGSLHVLNVSGGDVTLSFNRQDVVEAIRAKRIVTDMLRRGYALLVEVDGAYQRIQHFDEAHGVYVIADYDPSVMMPEESLHVQETPEAETPHEVTAVDEGPTLPKRRGRPRKSLPMERSRAVGIAPTAGG